MYQTLKDFAGPFATILAALAAVTVTAYFAWHQKKIAAEQARIAKEKLRFDLFDRRLAVFSSVFPYYEAIISWNGAPEQQMARTKFFHACQVSGFLFGVNSRVQELLKKMNEQGNTVIAFKEYGERLQQDKELYLQKFNEAQNIQVKYFPDSLETLRSAVAEYLNFHDI